MTGFGKATAEMPDKKITVEIKSLNSKQFDMSVRMPGCYRSVELELRGLVAARLERGKVEGTVRPDVDSTVASPAILGAFLGVSTLAGENRPADLNVERLVDALLSFIGFGVSARSKEELAAIA